MAWGPAEAALPRGRHRLTREAVEHSQRERMESAVIGLVAEQGLAATSVKAIVAQARVSRETFYLLYTSKDECYATALEAGAQRLASDLAVLAAAGGQPPALGEALEQLLDAVDADRQLARCLFVHAPSAACAPLLDAGVVPSLEAHMAGAPSFDVRALTRLVEVLVADALRVDPAGGVRALHAPLVGLLAVHAR